MYFFLISIPYALRLPISPFTFQVKRESNPHLSVALATELFVLKTKRESNP